MTFFPFEYNLIEGEELDISSSNIRKSYEDGVNLNSIIPEEVLNYISKNKLY
jgi:nicotinic acid mononucleotide adenylyltransferase